MSSYVLGLLREALRLHRENVAKTRRQRQWFAVAQAYNRLHTWRPAWGNPTWMCPECHAIHAPTEPSVWVGWLYPKCCGFPAGERHSECYAAPTPAKGEL